MVLAIVAAVLLGFLLYGISYLAVYLVPDASKVPSSTPAPSMIDELFGALLLIGLAALIAFSIVVIGLLINGLRNKNRFELLQVEYR
jgi:ABC-type phosphate transport system permease subunit